MGGPGSTRWNNHWKADTVEDYRWIDSGRWTREGIIQPGRFAAGTWLWKNSAGETVASIGYRADIDQDSGIIGLNYTARRNGAEPEALDYTVPVVSVARQRRGRLWYFICPLSRKGVACGRRVKRLYNAGRYFGCRHCYQLTYTSCQESHMWSRLWGELATEYGYRPKDIRRLLLDRF